jgi:hypothetical protein
MRNIHKVLVVHTYFKDRNEEGGELERINILEGLSL